VALPSAHYGGGQCGWHPLTGIEIPSEETLMEHILTAAHPGTNPAARARGLLARLARQISGMIARGRSRRGILRLSDRDLRDIAVTRKDLGPAAGFGSSRDLSDRLARQSGCRAGTW